MDNGATPESLGLIDNSIVSQLRENDPNEARVRLLGLQLANEALREKHFEREAELAAKKLELIEAQIAAANANKELAELKLAQAKKRKRMTLNRDDKSKDISAIDVELIEPD